MIGIGDTTIKRSRYRNPVGELGGFQLHQTKPAGLVWVQRPPVMIAKRVTRTSGDRYGRLARYLAAPGDPGGTRTPYLQIRNLSLYPDELRDHTGAVYNHSPTAARPIAGLETRSALHRHNATPGQWLDNRPPTTLIDFCRRVTHNQRR